MSITEDYEPHGLQCLHNAKYDTQVAENHSNYSIRKMNESDSTLKPIIQTQN